MGMETGASAVLQAAVVGARKSLGVLGVGVLVLCRCVGLVGSYRPLLNCTMPDNSRPGLTVAEVGRDSELTPPAHNNSLVFTLLPGRHRALFDIDPTSGRLYTGSTVDRDVICRGRARCDVALTVQARATRGDPATVTFVKVAVEVEDENDNRPTFDVAGAVVEVSEGAGAGARAAVLPRSRDADSPSNGVHRYLIESRSTGLFSVDHDDDTVYLITLGALDREVRDRYSLTLVAVDAGTPPLTGTLDVQVHVTDVDDNSPVFDRPLYRALVPEDARTGSRILTVHAADADVGDNGAVVYSLVQPPGDRLPFRVDSASGLITTSGSLDRESRAAYALTVRAVSRAAAAAKTGSSLSLLAAHARVHVNVSDVNDHAPTVVIATSHRGNCSHVIESRPDGAYVAHVGVEDADSGGGRVECQLNSDHFRLDRIFEDQYQVKAGGFVALRLENRNRC